MKVYKAINEIQMELSKVGITKNRKNTQGTGYNFRGIDDIFNTLSPLLAEHKLCILPRVISRVGTERLSKNGGVILTSIVEVEFDFVSAEDGSKHMVRTIGEAMDTSDKSTNKAMSAAYKYAAMQAFAIPTEGDNDSENFTHELSDTKKITDIDRAQIDNHLLKIEISASMTELEENFKDAIQFAKKYNDSYVNAEIISMKNKIKKIFELKK